VRGALQHLRAALELLLEALLQLREVAQRVARTLAVHLLRRGLELLHLRHELGRQSLSQQRLCLAELAGERAVQCSGGLELLLELLRRLPQLLHAIGHRALLLREGASLLGALVVHRLLILRARIAALLSALRAAIACLRVGRFVGALRERLLRRGSRTRLPHRRVAHRTRTASPGWS
jgi:hypothetical protein